MTPHQLIKYFINNHLVNNTIFDFIFSFIGSNKPFITNIVNFENKNNKNNIIPTRITFKYKDQYKYDINIISDELIINSLYNIIYLPIQSKTNISVIEANELDTYNRMNGTIITVSNNIKLQLPSNKIFEIYIFTQLKRVNFFFT